MPLKEQVPVIVKKQSWTREIRWPVHIVVEMALCAIKEASLEDATGWTIR
jgi:hypothetical protein